MATLTCNTHALPTITMGVGTSYTITIGTVTNQLKQSLGSNTNTIPLTTSTTSPKFYWV